MGKAKANERVAAPRATLAAILASTHDAIIGYTPLGVINSWNPAAAHLYGYAAEEIIGRNMDVLVAPDRREEEAEILRRSSGRATPLSTTTRRGWRRTGRSWRYRSPPRRSSTPPMPLSAR